jgi:hypothetical protein
MRKKGVAGAYFQGTRVNHGWTQINTDQNRTEGNRVLATDETRIKHGLKTGFSFAIAILADGFVLDSWRSVRKSGN